MTKLKHYITDFDLDTMMGTCTHCGTIDVKHRYDGSGKVRCGEGKRESNRYKRPPRPKEQRIKNGQNANRIRDEKYFGIPMAEIVKAKEKFLQEQNNVCAICQKELSFKNARLDHCHTTGELRGCLCSGCNLKLGMVEKHLEFIKDSIQYLNLD